MFGNLDYVRLLLICKYYELYIRIKISDENLIVKLRYAVSFQHTPEF